MFVSSLAVSGLTIRSSMHFALILARGTSEESRFTLGFLRVAV